MAVGSSFILDLQTDDPATAISLSVSIAIGYAISSGDFNFPTMRVLAPNLRRDLEHKEPDGRITKHSQKGLRISLCCRF